MIKFYLFYEEFYLEDAVFQNKIWLNYQKKKISENSRTSNLRNILDHGRSCVIIYLRPEKIRCVKLLFFVSCFDIFHCSQVTCVKMMNSCRAKMWRRKKGKKERERQGYEKKKEVKRSMNKDYIEVENVSLPFESVYESRNYYLLLRFAGGRETNSHSCWQSHFSIANC